MVDSTSLLYSSALTIALVHTLLGPDHYLPFIAMSQAGKWSLTKTVFVTVMCGIGHVLSSIVIGVIGIIFGLAVLRLESFESFRNELSGFLMIGFGLIYLVWGIRHALRNKPHTHWHVHADGTVHTHKHTHTDEHLHVHTTKNSEGIGCHAHACVGMLNDTSESQVLHQDIRPTKSHRKTSILKNNTSTLTPWILFTIFLFGPCELLIPLLMYPAARSDIWLVVGVVLIFGITTVVTMTFIVAAVHISISQEFMHRISGTNHFKKYSRFGHALAGFVVLLCGTIILLEY